MPDLDQIKQGEQVSARPARGRSLKPPTIEDGVRAGGSLAGRPQDIVEQLKAVERRYPGLGRRHHGAAIITRGGEHARPPA